MCYLRFTFSVEFAILVFITRLLHQFNELCETSNNSQNSQKKMKYSDDDSCKNRIKYGWLIKYDADLLFRVQSSTKICLVWCPYLFMEYTTVCILFLLWNLVQKNQVQKLIAMANEHSTQRNWMKKMRKLFFTIRNEWIKCLQTYRPVAWMSSNYSFPTFC